MDSVPSIIPLLEKEYRSSTRKLSELDQQLRFAATLLGWITQEKQFKLTVVHIAFNCI